MVNVDVTLHRKDIFPLFSEGEIWGRQIVNNTEHIIKLNVVIDQSKSIEIAKLKKDVIIAFDVIYDDVEEVLNKTRARINKTPKWTSAMKPDIFFLEYRNWPEYVIFLDYLLFTYPDITSRSYIGETIQGREIPLITLSTGGEPSSKPGFFIQAVVHAREWLANAATMYILNALAEGYGTDNRITNVLDSVNIYIAPTVNIDGYIYTWIGSSERMWRKNRRANGGGSFGVDLNRNWGPSNTWCTSGSSTNPNSDTYCGTAPFSEPETQASSQFIDDSTYNIQCGIDMHTYGSLILWPWQYTYTQLPAPYYQRFFDLGAELQQAIYDVNGHTYRSIQGSDLYPHSGGMIDYVWDQSEIAGFTFEGRGTSFAPPASDIIPAGQEQLAAVLTLAETLF